MSAFADAIQRLLDSDVSVRRARARKQAERFGWPAAVAGFLARTNSAIRPATRTQPTRNPNPADDEPTRPGQAEPCRAGADGWCAMMPRNRGRAGAGAEPWPAIRFAALGDSVTLGIGDPMPQGGWRGWAALLADSLAPPDQVELSNLACPAR